MNFMFDRKCNIVLYGAAFYGARFYDHLRESGFNVVGFIDKRAGEYSAYKGLPVWHINNVPDEFADCVIIVSVKNVFEHSMIARKLLEYGFFRIIYRPTTVIRGRADDEKRHIYDIFGLIENNALPSVPMSVPVTKEVGGHVFRDCAFIKECEGYYVVRVPLEILKTGNKVDKHSRFDSVYVSELTPHLSLYAFAAGEGAFPQPYIDYCIESAPRGVVTEAWSENVIRNRCMVYEEMSAMFELDPSFFVRNAPFGKWDQNGYFSMNSGKHRATFFYFKRMRYFPLKVSITDYEEWINRPALNELLKMLVDVDSLNIKIPHPFFYDFPAVSDVKVSDEVNIQIKKLLRQS